MIYELTGFQPTKAAVALFPNRKPNPFTWFSSSLEYSTVVSSLVNFPWPVHLISLIPNTSSLYLFLSLKTWANFLLSKSVLTFHVPVCVIFLALKTLVLKEQTSFQLSSALVILASWEAPSSSKRLDWPEWPPLAISVVVFLFFTGWGYWPFA